MHCHFLKISVLMSYQHFNPINFPQASSGVSLSYLQENYPTKTAVDSALSLKYDKSGGAITGDMSISGDFKVNNRISTTSTTVSIGTSAPTTTVTLGRAGVNCIVESQLNLVSTGNQLAFRPTSGAQALINVGPMGSTRQFLLPDSGVTQTSFALTNGAQTFSGDLTVTGNLKASGYVTGNSGLRVDDPDYGRVITSDMIDGIKGSSGPVDPGIIIGEGTNYFTEAVGTSSQSQRVGDVQSVQINWAWSATAGSGVCKMGLAYAYPSNGTPLFAVTKYSGITVPAGSELYLRGAISGDYCFEFVTLAPSTGVVTQLNISSFSASGQFSCSMSYIVAHL